jgi:cytochrome d ubiquinol oxidase subunit I
MDFRGLGALHASVETPMEPPALLPARLQMAFTLGFHIIFACLGVGLPVLMLFAEWRFLRGGGEEWRTLARRWSKAFFALFAVGAVSGTVLSFELGLLWPEFMGRFGSVIGLPFALEAFAFFLEAIFIAIYLYGWDRLKPWAHWWSGVPVVIAGAASALFVVAANAWMNAPRGFKLDEAGKVMEVDPLAAMLNPATAPQAVHMLVAAYMVAGFLTATCYAAALLFPKLGGSDARARAHNRKGLALGLGLGCLCAPVQIVIGDWAAQMVAQTQPVKLAAMEGQFETERGAPLRIGGLPNMDAARTPWAIEIPGALSWLAYRDAQAEVRGLNDFPEEDLPPVAIVHIAFQLMVGAGFALLGLALWTAWLAWKKRDFAENRWFLWAALASGPLAVLALEAGWTVTEVGRQPWIIQGVMRTRDAVTTAPGAWGVFGTVMAVYAILFVGTAAALRWIAAQPLPSATAGNAATSEEAGHDS